MDTLISDLIHELQCFPLIPSAYHRKLNCGSSHTFGLVPKRSCTPELSSISIERTRLYSLLSRLATHYGIQDYTSITVQHNYSLIRRKEKAGGPSHLIVLGTYQDTGIQIGERGLVNTQGLLTFDTSKESLVPSRVSKGDRYLILYHSVPCENFQPPTFSEHNGSVKLHCGEHTALSRRTFSVRFEEKETIIDFS